MFTGLVTAVGAVKNVRRTKRGVCLTIGASYGGLAIGESIAVDGVCLTVVKKGRGWFTVEAIETTRGRTTLGELKVGSKVNLERALAAGDRLGGHLVSGHVDGVGKVVARRESGDELQLDVAVPPDVYALCVPRGSITIDGVSLTIAALRNGARQGTVRVALIPHTRDTTTLGAAAVGDRVHLESDLIGKYVQHLMPSHRAAPRRRRPR
jgi:riboflavin synthase